jgi:hypothetical protein
MAQVVEHNRYICYHSQFLDRPVGYEYCSIERGVELWICGGEDMDYRTIEHLPVPEYLDNIIWENLKREKISKFRHSYNCSLCDAYYYHDREEGREERRLFYEFAGDYIDAYLEVESWTENL